MKTQREYIFRGKNSVTNQWGEINLLDIASFVGRWYYATIGQYTGLLDKNGKKIFEGDIVLYKVGPLDLGTRYTVYFSEERGGYFPFAHGDGCGCCEDETVWDTEWCEIIGNIHDNPELEEDNT